jgi:hypothetical protein
MRFGTIIIAVWLATAAVAQEPVVEREAAIAATANKGLATLRNLAALDPVNLGMTAEEAPFARLLDPLPVRLLSVRSLRRFTRGADAQPLLRDIDTFYYPVAVGNEIRALITVEQLNGEWRATEFGASSVARRIAELQLTFGEGHEVVFVPGLGLHFLAGRRGGKLLVAPFSDVDETDLRRGTAVEAGTAFLQLVPRARSFKLEADAE